MKAGLAREWQFRVAFLYLILVALVVAAGVWWPLIILPLLFLIVRTQRRILRWHEGQGDRWRKILNPRLVLTVLSINFTIDIAMFWGMLKWITCDVLTHESELSRSPSSN